MIAFVIIYKYSHQKLKIIFKNSPEVSDDANPGRRPWGNEETVFVMLSGTLQVYAHR